MISAVSSYKNDVILVTHYRFSLNYKIARIQFCYLLDLTTQ